MCGIVGYVGARQAPPIILEGLKKLEYRGYDSAGIATQNGKGIELLRAEGELINLERLLTANPVSGSCGIGHTRWATHGRPSVANAHPHRAGGVVVVHNGIIENYLALRDMLTRKGHSFSSETDTEVISHLVENFYRETGDFLASVRMTLAEVRGAYAIAVLCEQEPGKMVAARSGSPLVIGQGQEEFFVASDVPAILAHTREMIFLEDGELAWFAGNTMTLMDLAGNPVTRLPKTITWNPAMAEKGGYRHFMLKEIYEQPRAIADTLAGRIHDDQTDVVLDGLGLCDEELQSFRKVFLVACGTSWHAALVGKFLIEKLARVPVEVDIASEFRYRDPIVDEGTLTVLISQSGETADTLAALREAKGKQGKAVAICNVVDSSRARESDGVIYTHAGPEIGVASTKAFTTQLVAFILLALRLGRAKKSLTDERLGSIIAALKTLPSKIQDTLAACEHMEEVARTYAQATDFLFLGRGNQYPIALEGALKLKEISYIHAEGYPAGEMKHGPIALIDDQLPVVVIATQNEGFEKVFSNMEEVRARGGKVIVITDGSDDGLRNKADVVLTIPAIADELMPVLTAIPLQLLAYHVAVLRGTDVDQPRNLAKSVTVE
jgi:glucosamine--fructose-6-phosphate aminotransferase (isomerizing)